MNDARKSIAFYCALLGLVLLAYAPVMIQGGFIWDDDQYVQLNKAIQTPGGLATIWTSPRSLPQYYPVVFTTFFLEYRLWGLHPAGYHLVNILLHAFNAMLVWRILRKLKVPGAALAAMLFAVHPVMVESVAWITERKNVLALAFFLLSLWVYLRFEPGLIGEAGVRRWRFWILSLVCFLLALASKSIACTLPFCLLLLGWYRTGTLKPRHIWPLLPFVFAGLAAGMYTAHLERTHVGAIGPEWDFSVAQRLLIAGRALLFYPAKLLVPVPLTFNYPRWDISAGNVWQYLFPAAAIALLAGAVMATRRFGRGPAAAALFYAINIAPALGFFNIWPMRFSFVADHFQYVAAIGILAALAALLTRLGRPLNMRMRYLAAGGLVTALVGMTFAQGFIYQGLEMLWTDTLRKNPDSWMAHENLGIILVQTNRFPEAVSHLERALAIKGSHHIEIYPNLGWAYFKNNQVRRAIDFLKTGLDQDGDNIIRAVIANTLGAIYASQNDMPQALNYFSQSVSLDPLSAMSLGNLALAELTLGRNDAARIHAQQSLQHDPQNLKAQQVLSRLRTMSAPANGP